MAQLNFAYNYNFNIINLGIPVNSLTLTFCPLVLFDSLSWLKANIPVVVGGTRTVTKTFSISIGLYSLTGSTLSIANSIFGSQTFQYEGGKGGYLSMTSTSATQNITPGTWYFGVNFFTGGIATDHSSASFYANSSIAPGNAIPGNFLMGRVTASTNAMPTSIATSNLDITGADAIRQPYIIITA